MVFGVLTMITASSFLVGMPVYRATSWWSDRRHRLALQQSRRRRRT